MSLAKLHAGSMQIVWIVLINIWIIAGTFTSSKLSVYIHIIGCVSIIILSIVDTFQLAKDNVSDLDPSDQKFYFHVIFGCFCLCLMLYQYISGALTKISNKFGFKSVNILNIKRLHMVSGIIITVLIKIQIYRFIDASERPKWYVYDFLSLAVYLAAKNLKPRLVFDSSFYSQAKELRKVNSLSSLMKEAAIPCVYGNYVYDLSKLQEWHPAGLQIIESVKYSQIEKYMFGIYSAAKIPAIKAYAHSKMSLNLLEEPIARLDIPSNFAGINKQNTAKISELRLCSKSVYQLHLKLDEGELSYLPYSDVKQLGRFYCLTLNSQITRLYTCVNFLQYKNVMFLKQHLKPSKALEEYFQKRTCVAPSIPILFKHYANGLFTNPLVRTDSPALRVSQQQGLGFQLDELEPGEIVLIAGGTGIYPFLDLIDLLYKNHLAAENPQISSAIFDENPLLKSGLLEKHSFKVYCALQTIEELHPVVLQMFKQLCHSSKVKITLNVKQPKDKPQHESLHFTQERFEAIVAKYIDNKDLSKIYICGPQNMNDKLTSVLQSKEKNSNKYLIV